MESIHFGVTAQMLPATTVGRLVDSSYFKVDKGHLTADSQLLLTKSRMRTLVILSGGGSIVSAQAEPVVFAAGDCLVIPAAYEGAVKFNRETTYLTVTL
jgi:mannose-6-phosphate isomerase-like protein (cupin superfamily)